MSNDYELLALSAPVGKGQENRPDDVAAFDNSLRRIGAYEPPPEYADEPQRYATEAVIDALDRFQDKNGLKVDGIANPGGPTERAINNRLLNKPRGAGLMLEPPPPIGDNVGNGMANEARDVASVKRRLGALDYLPEDPFDAPSGIIDEATTSGIKRFQLDNRLTPDGWMAPGGETERALDNALSDTARSEGPAWFSYVERAARMQALGEDRPSHDSDSVRRDDSDAGASGEIVPAKGAPSGWPPPAPPQRPGLRTGPAPNQLFGINPNYVPHRGDTEPVRLPRDLEWANPGARPSPPARPVLPRPQRIPRGDEWEPPTPRDIERALKQEPLPDPNSLITYAPEPGSPLAIPIIDLNPFGRPGDPRTQELNETVAKAIEKACQEVLGKKATVTHVAGPGSVKNGETAVRRKNGDGRSFPDFETMIEYRDVTIRIFGDTYTSLVNRDPNAREQRQFAKLDRNARDHNRIYVRLPKAWLFGEEINLDKLGDFTRELCREVKKVVDEGQVGDGKKKLRLEKIVKNLTKKKVPGVKTLD